MAEQTLHSKHYNAISTMKVNVDPYCSNPALSAKVLLISFSDPSHYWCLIHSLVWQCIMESVDSGIAWTRNIW